MTMTPEGRAVIQAAIRHRTANGQISDLTQALDRAVFDLIYACPQCNAGGHVCPGDGNPIGHGDTDCGEHDELRPEQPQWIARMWEDVRPGDRVQLPGTEHVAEVASAVALPWHVHPAADPYRPNEKRAEWQCINVHLHERESALSMDPAAPIEIELTPSEVAAIEALGGWSNRVRQERA